MVECAGFENRSARKGSESSNLSLSVRLAALAHGRPTDSLRVERPERAERVEWCPDVVDVRALKSQSDPYFDFAQFWAIVSISAAVTQLVESLPSKQMVEGSSPFRRFSFSYF